MKTRSTLAVGLLALLLTVSACGSSDDDKLRTRDAWTRVTASGQTTGAVYVTVTGGKDADSLTGVTVPASVAATAQLHQTTHDGMSKSGMDAAGMQGMKPVAAIAIPAGKTVTLKPGGFHIMLMDLKAPVADGTRFPVQLVFKRAGTVTVDAVARR